MHDSLLKSGAHFRLFVFTFDTKSYQMISELSLPHVTVISQEEFENERLKDVKRTREFHEYLWTCTPWTVGYVLDNFQVDHCTYIDADIFFFSNPTELIDELKEKSVLITEHRYTRRYDQTRRSGIYCVQFVTFKNNEDGKTALNWWMERCLEWCYDRVEDGKFGDQKYLDDWIERFKGVHILEHLGGGVAPWNIQQYDVCVKDGQIFVNTKTSSSKLIFYHFHDIKFYEDDKVDLGVYKLTVEDQNILYHHYLRQILKAEAVLKTKFSFARQTQRYFYRNKLLTPIHRFVRRVLNIYHVININAVKN